jgi:hypothetical protein
VQLIVMDFITAEIAGYMMSIDEFQIRRHSYNSFFAAKISSNDILSATSTTSMKKSMKMGLSFQNEPHTLKIILLKKGFISISLQALRITATKFPFY